MACTGLLLSGCVVGERYQAEKARALNFQRLLVQEERKTGELDSELKRVKREAAELEARTRELSAQLQAVREQYGRSQEEMEILRASLQSAREEAVRKARPATKPAGRQDFLKSELPRADGKENPGIPQYHEVKPGDTLTRLARQYRVDLNKLRNWNQLEDDTIEVGQRLLVGYQ